MTNKRRTPCTFLSIYVECVYRHSEKIFNKPLSEIPIQDEIAYMQELGRQARVAERMFYLDDVIENLEKGAKIITVDLNRQMHLQRGTSQSSTYHFSTTKYFENKTIKYLL